MPSVWLDPSNWLRELRLLTDDGLDWDITLTNGSYNLSTAGFSGLTLRKHKGGSIYLHAKERRKVLFYSTTYDSTASLTIQAKSVYLDGLVIQGEPSPVTSFTSFVNPRRIFFTLGGIDSSDLWITNSTFVGDGIYTLLLPSLDASTYTNIVIQDVLGDNIGRNGTITIRNGGSTARWNGGYAHIRAAGLRSTALSGVDGPPWGGPYSTHGSGGLLLEVGPEWAGSSTLLVEDCYLLNQIQGSHNHDLHVFRLTGYQSNAIRASFKDCFFRGEWIGGHISGQEGGDGILWLVYTHYGGHIWPTTRPHIEFENCRFSTWISDQVQEFSPNIECIQYSQQASADVEWWDCAFDWQDDTGYYQPQADGYGFGSPHRVRSCDSLAPYSSFSLHNCTHFPNDGLLDPAYPDLFGTFDLSIDSQTRHFKERALWRRRAQIAEITPLPKLSSPGAPFSNSCTDPDFSLGLWTLDAGATIQLVGGPYLQLESIWSSGVETQHASAQITNLLVDLHGISSTVWAYVNADSANGAQLAIRSSGGVDPDADIDLATHGYEIGRLSTVPAGWSFQRISNLAYLAGVSPSYGTRLRLYLVPPTSGSGTGTWLVDSLAIVPYDENLSLPSLIVDPGFESGGLGWTFTGGASVNTDGWYPPTVYPWDRGTSVASLPRLATATCRIVLPDVDPYRTLFWYVAGSNGVGGTGAPVLAYTVTVTDVDSSTILTSSSSTILGFPTGPPGRWSSGSLGPFKPISPTIDITFAFPSGGWTGSRLLLDGVVLL